MAVVFGAMSAGQSSAFAPDFGEAKLSALRMIKERDDEMHGTLRFFWDIILKHFLKMTQLFSILSLITQLSYTKNNFLKETFKILNNFKPAPASLI